MAAFPNKAASNSRKPSAVLAVQRLCLPPYKQEALTSLTSNAAREQIEVHALPNKGVMKYSWRSRLVRLSLIGLQVPPRSLWWLCAKKITYPRKSLLKLQLFICKKAEMTWNALCGLRLTISFIITYSRIQPVARVKMDGMSLRRTIKALVLSAIVKIKAHLQATPFSWQNYLGKKW